MNNITEYKDQIRKVKLEDLRPVDSRLSAEMKKQNVPVPKVAYELRLSSYDERQAQDIGSIMPDALDHLDFKEMIEDLEEFIVKNKETLNVREVFVDYSHGQVYVY